MVGPLRVYGWLLGLLLAPVALAEPLMLTAQGPGFSLPLPAAWEQKTDVMGMALIARKPRATDPEGWGHDLLTVSSETTSRRTCLDGFALRKVQQYAYHATRFQQLEEETLELGGEPALRFTLRYTEGPRELMALVQVMQSGPRYITATFTAPPDRFEPQREQMRSLLAGLRPAAAPRKANR